MTNTPETMADFEGFARDVMEGWEAHCDLEASEKFELAQKHNLLRAIPGGFDPEAHCDEYGNSEPGDDWFELNYPLGHADTRPAPAVEGLLGVARRAVSGEGMAGDAYHDLNALLSSQHYALAAYEGEKRDG